MQYHFKQTLTFLVALLIGCTRLSAGTENEQESNKTFTIVLDAGHGGHDAGAIGAFSKEKDINLKVTLEVGRLLAANSPEVKIVYTRRTDVFIPLDTRAEIANKNKADLFVSIHTNSLPKGNIAYGSETYTLGMARAAANLEVAKRENSVITYEKNYKQTYEGFDPNKAESYIIFELLQDRYMKQSVELARCIQQQYVGAGRKNKGVHQAGFLVLRKTSMPAVLTELGFISTPEEERYLNSTAGVQALAKSIYNGIAKYRGTQGRMIPQTISPIIVPSEIDKAEPNRLSDANNDLQVTNGLEPAVVPVDPYPQGNNKPRNQEAERQELIRQERAEKARPRGNEAENTRTTTQTQPRNVSTQTHNVTPQPRANQTAKRDSTPTRQMSTRQMPAGRSNDNSRQETPANQAKKEAGKPVFKIQIFVTDRQLKTNDARLKGLQNVSFYKDGNAYKYTVGETTSYQEIRKLQQSLGQNHPGNFIVAFKDGQRINLSEAIKLSK